MLLRDKVVLVTGAARGIGLAIARLMAREGAQVMLSGRSADALEGACEIVRSQHPEASLATVVIDVARPESVRDGFRALQKRYGRLDVLVSNAGILDDALIGMVTAAQIQRTFETNTFGVLYCAQYASRLMARTKAGSIINMTSIIGSNGNVGQSVYAGSKAAVIGITRSLAKELAPQNIRVNAIAPGFIDTAMARSIGEMRFQERLRSIGMGRIGSPDEVAGVALFLASELSSYVTGQVIGVDGEMLI